jgi:hypothetical protein
MWLFQWNSVLKNGTYIDSASKILISYLIIYIDTYVQKKRTRDGEAEDSFLNIVCAYRKVRAYRKIHAYVANVGV